MSRSRLRLPVAAVAAVLVLTSCGSERTPAVDGPPLGAAPPADACADGESDCVVPIGDDAPEPDVDDGPADLDAAREAAQGLVGLPEDEALAQPGVRLGRRGAEEMMLTMDLRPGRLTVETDDDGSGVFRVTMVVLETEDEPETFR